MKVYIFILIFLITLGFYIQSIAQDYKVNGQVSGFSQGKVTDKGILIHSSVGQSMMGISLDSTVQISSGISQLEEFVLIRDTKNNSASLPKGEIDETQSIPQEFKLYQNFPNPFNPLTTIRYDLAKSSRVVLTIYDVLGAVVKTVVSDQLSAGRYMYQWNAGNVASGVYFYLLETDYFVENKKMLLLK